MAKNKLAVVLKRLLLLFISSTPLIYVKAAFAQEAFDPGTGEISKGAATIKGFEKIFSNLITVALEFAGIILFIMFLVAGFKYTTSQGDPKALEGAKGTLTHAIIGLIILILATVFLSIIGVVTGVNTLNFKVTQP